METFTTWIFQMWVLQIYVFPSLFHLTSEVKRKRSWNISPSVSGWLGDHKNKWEMRGGREVTLITSHKIVCQGIGELAIGWNADECEGNWCIGGIGICEQRNKGVFRREAFRIMISSRTFLKQFALGTLSEKNYGIIWEFFPNGGPPLPPFWEPLIQKKNYRLFCILDP